MVSADEARFAIYPITVASPILIQIPVPEPAVHEVPKNATFFDSKIFGNGSAPGSTWISSDSPVREALFTLSSLLLKMTKSAGILSPLPTTTTSPGTSNLASTYYFLPSRTT